MLFKSTVSRSAVLTIPQVTDFLRRSNALWDLLRYHHRLACIRGSDSQDGATCDPSSTSSRRNGASTSILQRTQSHSSSIGRLLHRRSRELSFFRDSQEHSNRPKRCFAERQRGDQDLPRSVWRFKLTWSVRYLATSSPADASLVTGSKSTASAGSSNKDSPRVLGERRINNIESPLRPPVNSRIPVRKISPVSTPSKIRAPAKKNQTPPTLTAQRPPTSPSPFVLDRAPIPAAPAFKPLVLKKKSQIKVARVDDEIEAISESVSKTGQSVYSLLYLHADRLSIAAPDILRASTQSRSSSSFGLGRPSSGLGFSEFSYCLLRPLLTLVTQISKTRCDDLLPLCFVDCRLRSRQHLARRSQRAARSSRVPTRCLLRARLERLRSQLSPALSRTKFYDSRNGSS